MSGSILPMRLLGTIQGNCEMVESEKNDGVDVFFVDDIADIDIDEYNEMSESDKKEYCAKVSGFVGCEPDELFSYLTEVLS